MSQDAINISLIHPFRRPSSPHGFAHFFPYVHSVRHSRGTRLGREEWGVRRNEETTHDRLGSGHFLRPKSREGRDRGGGWVGGREKSGKGSVANRARGEWVGMRGEEPSGEAMNGVRRSGSDDRKEDPTKGGYE